jgi:DNA-binding response OmpR family regulator
MSTVLVIENDVPALRLMAWGLMEEGFEVGMAHVPDALARVRTKPPDVIVFNTLAPAEQKAALIKEFRQTAPTVRIVDVSDSDGAGADVRVPLPIRVDVIVDAIRELAGD